MSRKYKLVIFVPEQAIELLKSALFKAGAGRLGNYDSCSWQTRGLGQFRPLEGSSPYLGSRDEIEEVNEWRLETVVEEKHLNKVLEALKDTHPYEEPAYDVIKLEN
ncbi:MAG: NGG1p interacting factor NIF3 [Porticoccaceae bacterium]|jgi:hypothetical protein|nr:NGG1p interacting factor NIF3 [Porticoccaceae bacterium]